MAIAIPFYHGVIRKYVAVFGTLFNNIVIKRNDNDGNQVQKFVVPISYGPWPHYMALRTEDPKQAKKKLISLPRMSYEITNIAYDTSRKVAGGDRYWKCSTDGVTKVMAGVPYNIDFSLYIMVKYSEDAAKIAEQIIPFFNPEWTSSVRLIKDMEPVNVPLVLNSVTIEDTYEQDFVQRRVMIWTLTFTMKGFFFGPAFGPSHGNENGEPWDPERDKEKLIRFVDVSNYAGSNEVPFSRVNVYPGLTEDGEPTSDPNETIPWIEIDETDDWGLISEIKTGEDVLDP